MSTPTARVGSIPTPDCQANKLQGYAVESIVSHVSKGLNMNYVKKWYGYVPEDDTVDPGKHIIEHLISPNRRQVWKTSHEGDEMEVEVLKQ